MTSKIDLLKISYDFINILDEFNYLMKIKIEYFLANNYFVLKQTILQIIQYTMKKRASLLQKNHSILIIEKVLLKKLLGVK